MGSSMINFDAQLGTTALWAVGLSRAGDGSLTGGAAWRYRQRLVIGRGPLGPTSAG